MPWKTKNEQEQRLDLVRALGSQEASISQVCRQWGISRKTAYKWQKRYEQNGLRGLASGSRRPQRIAGRTEARWRARLRRLRRQRPSWGARKLWHWLARGHKAQGLPSIATIGRWLRSWGLTRRRRRRLSGPVVERERLTPARRANEVWTVDFKGWYRTGDGTRVDPLTVRDLYSRYGLRVALLRSQKLAVTQREFRRIFRRYGLPQRIRCDNGTPFGGGGPTGLTRLSAWWVKLGIVVEFITPGRPCENGAHEQFHRVYKAEVARHPAKRLREQQRRTNAWLRIYNHQRPHEALGMAVPAELYRKSKRRLPAVIGPWRYPRHWERRWVKGNGQLNWRGVRRFVGEAFVRDYVGMEPVEPGVWRVHFGPKLVGELHENERGNLRTAKYRTRRAGALARPHSGSLRSPP